MKPTIDLTGLPIDDAVALATTRLDARFAMLLAHEECKLIRDGVGAVDRAAMLDGMKGDFAQGRSEFIDELRAWLLAEGKRLH